MSSTFQIWRWKKLTWESYIKALIAHGEVWYKAKLNTEVPKEACFHTGGQHWASESSNGILEIAVLDDGKVIVILLQMERVEHQMDTWKPAGGWCMIERTDTELETGSEIVFTQNGLSLRSVWRIKWQQGWILKFLSFQRSLLRWTNSSEHCHRVIISASLAVRALLRSTDEE